MVYEWRRALRGTETAADRFAMELTGLDVGETHRACWWTTRWVKGQQGTEDTTGNGLIFVGLVYAEPGGFGYDPVDDPDAPWLDRVSLAIRPQLWSTNWIYSADLGVHGRKAKAQRRNTTAYESLYACVRFFSETSSDGWWNEWLMNVTTDSLISNPTSAGT